MKKLIKRFCKWILREDLKQYGLEAYFTDLDLEIRRQDNQENWNRLVNQRISSAIGDALMKDGLISIKSREDKEHGGTKIRASVTVLIN